MIAKKLGLVGKFVGNLTLLASMSSCSYFPADGIHSTGGLINPCKDECRLNAEFRASIALYQDSDDLPRVHEADANGESGWIPSIDCIKCYP